ncbi:nucleoside triphosphate hydrolase, partial [Pseudomonas sp. HMWF031]
MSTLVSNEFELEPADSKRLSSLCGPFDDNIKQIERRLGVEITYRNNAFKVLGEPQQIKSASELLKLLYVETQPIKGRIPELEAEQVHLAIQEARVIEKDATGGYGKEVNIKTKRGVIKPRNPNQAQYVANIVNHD